METVKLEKPLKFGCKGFECDLERIPMEHLWIATILL